MISHFQDDEFNPEAEQLEFIEVPPSPPPGDEWGVETVIGLTSIAGVGAFTLALLKFAYGAIRDAMKAKDAEIDRLHSEIGRLRK